MKMKIAINHESTEEFDASCGSPMSIEEFIDCCKNDVFIDYDGYAEDIILNNKVIGSEVIYPSEIHSYEKQLRKIKNDLGEIQIVWYNR